MATCPKCGALLEYDPQGGCMVCPRCHKVPKEIMRDSDIRWMRGG